jgi:hypothetical protein
MDAAVDQTLSRTDDEKGASKAAYLRRTQQKERAQMAAEIAQSQTNITALQDQRAPVAAEVRKVVAEVGPIKYIAELFYDNADSTILDKAVRWVIILLVVVFDPLAIIMLVAANHSLRIVDRPPIPTKSKPIKQKMPEWLLRSTRVKRMKKLHEKKRKQKKANNTIEIDKDSLITF